MNKIRFVYYVYCPACRYSSMLTTKFFAKFLHLIHKLLPHTRFCSRTATILSLRKDKH